MRSLELQDGNWDQWKFGDTDAVMTFSAKVDGYKNPDYANSLITFKLARADQSHKLGNYVATAPGYVDDSGRLVKLNTSDIKQLEPGTYAVELWLSNKKTQKDAVYPSDSFVFFTIDENTMGISDIANISTMTLQAVYADLLDKIKAFKTGPAGKDAVQPVFKIGKVTRLNSDQAPTFTMTQDKDNPALWMVDVGLPSGFDGKDAVQPKFNISVTTLEADKDANATVTASADLATYNVVIGIPKGQDGTNGVTPTIGSNGNWFLGDKDTGLSSRGPQGLPGKDGKTPVKGTDYWTDADKQEIQAEGQNYIESTLSKISLQPEAFENEAALKAKYPNGNPGIMVTVDTGHKWLYVSGAWKDCGQYQGVALAESDRQQLDNALVGDNVLADASSEPYNDLDKLPINRIVTYASDISSVKNAPNIVSGSSHGATVITMAINPKTNSGAVQMLFNSDGGMYYRLAWGDPAAYGSWNSIQNGNYVQFSGKAVPDVYKDLNTFPANSEVLITDNIGNLKNIPSQLVGTSYAAAISTESVGNNSSGTIQKVFVVDTNDIYERLAWGGENTYHPWILLANGDFYKPGKMTGVETGAPYDDLNTFPLGQTVTIAETPDKIGQIKNLPPISNTVGGLTVRTESSINDTIGGIQIAIDNNNVMYHRICWGASGRWGAWRSDSVDEHSNDMILPTLSLFQKVGVVGDSYASGELAFDGKNVDHYEISWLQILARKDGFNGTNFSMGGMSTRTWLTNPKCMPLMQSSDAQDLYILALGINDEALGVSYIGSEADIDNGADTFYGNYGKIIKAIQTKSPQAKLVIATIADSSDIATQFNEAITTIANHFNIPVIVQLDDPLFNSSFYKDNMVGGHPTGPVYSSMAEAYERLIGQSMIDHLDYYKTFKKDA